MKDNIDIVYTKNTLYVNVFGCVDLSIIKKINSKINIILKDFEIPNIVINFNNSTICNKDEVYEFLEHFNHDYAYDIKILEN